MSSGFGAPSAVAILSTALLCAFSSPAMSQTTGSSSLPSKDTTQFLGWRNADAWWYCSSLLAGGKLSGEKNVAELKRPGR
jgi:hypothetical protein